jgi:hypothetical protein
VVVLLLLALVTVGCGAGATKGTASADSSSAYASDPLPGDWTETGAKGAPATTIQVQSPRQGEYPVTWSFGKYGDAVFAVERKTDDRYAAIVDEDGIRMSDSTVLPGPPLVEIVFQILSERRMEVTYTYDLGYPLEEETHTARFARQDGAP